MEEKPTDDAREVPSSTTDECSCAPGPCCPVPLADPAGRASAGGRWKAVAFVLVMLAAAAVMAHGLYTARATGPKSTDLTSDVASVAASEAAPKADPSEWVRAQSIESVFEHGGFAFVVLAGPEGSSAEELRAALSEATARIQAQDVSVTTFLLDSNAQGFSEAVGNLGIDAFPAVLAVKPNCGAALLRGEVSTDKLLRAYLACSSASGACCAGPPASKGSDRGGMDPAGL